MSSFSPASWVLLLISTALLLWAVWPWLASRFGGDGGEPSGQTTNGPNSPVIGGDVIGSAIGAGATVMGDDNRKGFFNEAPNYGSQEYNEGPKQRVMPIGAFVGIDTGASVYIRPTEQQFERVAFAQSIHSALLAAGISAGVQLGYSQHTLPFRGVEVRPGPDAAEVGRMIAGVIASTGVPTHIGGAFNGSNVLILIGEC